MYIKHNQDFYSWLLLRGKKETTAYKYCLLLSVLQRRHIKTQPDFDNYLLELKKQNKRNTTLNWYITTWKFWNEFNGQKVETNYFKKQEAYKSVLSIDELEKFIDTLEPETSWGMFWKLCIFTGMRMGEVAKQTKQTVDFGLGVFRVEESKTGRPRNVPIPQHLIEELKNYISKLKTEYLFVTKRGCIFSDHSWSHDFLKRIKQIGIVRKGLTPYSLRHSFATRMLSADVNIHKLAKILGHSVEMTARYEHLIIEDIKQAMRSDPMVTRTKEEVIQKIKEYVIKETKGVLKTSIVDTDMGLQIVLN